MDLRANKIDEHLYTLSLSNSKFDVIRIRQLLKGLDESEWRKSYERDNIRYIADYLPKNTPESPLPDYKLNAWNYRQELIDLKEKLIDLLLVNDVFLSKKLRGQNKTEIMEKTILNSNYYCVGENFTMGRMHADEPIDDMLAHGLIYFLDDDFPQQSTIFRSWDDSHNIVIRTGWEKGWMVVAHEKSLHAITNYGEARYGIKFWLKWI